MPSSSPLPCHSLFLTVCVCAARLCACDVCALQMALRMERSVANAAALANFLSSHPLVTRLNSAGLPSHPGAATHAAQASGGGAVLSFETGV